MRELERLAKELHEPRYAGKTILVCWHHGNLPELAGKLGVKEPKNWKDATCFNDVQRRSFSSGLVATPTFEQIVKLVLCCGHTGFSSCRGYSAVR